MVFLFGDVWLGNRHKPIFLNLVPSQGLNRDNGPNCVVAGGIVMALPRKKPTIFCRFSDLAIFGLEIVISQFFELGPSQGPKRDSGPNCVVAGGIVMALPRKKNNDFLPVVRFGDI